MKVAYEIGEKVFNAHLGFFSNPIYIDGDKVLKTYNLNLRRNQIDALQEAHRDFIAGLRSLDIHVPDTSDRIVAKSGGFTLEITQDRFEPAELAGERIKHEHLEKVIETTNGIVTDSLKFLSSDLVGFIGFHPSVRNYAFRQGTGYMLDTFPPYTSESQTRKMMWQAAPTVKSKVAMTLLYPFLGIYTSEYYQATPMLQGILSTATRLRPEHAQDIRREANFLIGASNLPSREKVIDELSREEKSRFKWDFMHAFYRK